MIDIVWQQHPTMHSLIGIETIEYPKLLEFQDSNFIN